MLIHTYMSIHTCMFMQMETSIIETSFSDGEEKQDDDVKFSDREPVNTEEKQPPRARYVS